MKDQLAGAVDRPITAILSDIASNIQHIVRSEIRLAKAETSHELARLRRGAIWCGIAAFAGLASMFCLILATIYGLAQRLPPWAAALVVGTVLLTIAGVCVAVGIKSLKAPSLPRTTRTLKETLTWSRT